MYLSSLIEISYSLLKRGRMISTEFSRLSIFTSFIISCKFWIDFFYFAIILALGAVCYSRILISTEIAPPLFVNLSAFDKKFMRIYRYLL